MRAPGRTFGSNGRREVGHYTPRRMRILVNPTSARLGGGITVLRNLLPALVAVDGGRHEYFVVAHADAAQAMDPKHPRVHFEVARPGHSLVSRLAFLPNKDVAFAGIAVFLIGHDVEIGALMTLIAGLIVATHVAVGTLLAATELAERRAAR